MIASTLSENFSTIAVGLVLAVLTVAAIAVMISNRRQGKSSCTGGCSCCPMSGGCKERQKHE